MHPALLQQMRLGKSVVALRASRTAQPRNGNRLRTLIVAPNSALDGWEEELAKEKQKRVCRLRGDRKHRMLQLCFGDDFVLMNKEGWRSLPEIASRKQCESCGGQGKLRSTRGLEVVNKRREAFDVYIGRGSKWGNPYRIGEHGTRDDVIQLYRAHMLTSPTLLADLHELANKRLGCFCAPLPCHGDVLKQLVRERVSARYCVDCGGKGYGPVFGPTVWDHTILDESFIRNPQTRITKFFLSSFRDVPHRWLLTGLPNPESRLDYWTQFAWLDGHAFGCRSYWQFRAEYFKPRTYGYGWQPQRGAAKKIDEYVGKRAFVQTRRSAGVDVKKVYEKRTLDFPASVRKLYDDAEDDFVRRNREGDFEETSFAGARWQWMRALCGGFQDGKLVWPGKLNELRDLLTGELAREQVVVWFAHTAEIENAERVLKKAKVTCATYYGKTRQSSRAGVVKLFERGGVRVLLAQESLGKTGVRLGAADTAIYYSNRPDFDSRSQSEDRILLVTKKVPLLYIDLIVADTIDVDVRDTIRMKRWRTETSSRRAILARMEKRHAAK
jgi:hypothetical protein